MDSITHNNPTVSVIIPAYGAPDYLNQAVASVCSQTFTDYEIIVIDDASGDHIVSQYKLPESVRLICRKERFGAAAAARNSGLEVARGKYVAFLDQDDIWLPDKLAKQVKLLEDNPQAALVFCHYTLVNKTLDPLEKQDDPKAAGSDAFLKMIDHCFIRTPSTVLVRRDVVEECGGFDESIIGASDWDLYIRITRNHPLISTDEALVKYRMHPGQLHKQKKMMDVARIRIMDKTLTWAVNEQPAMVGRVKRCYGKVYWQVGKYFIREEPSRRTALGYLFKSIAMWPWSYKPYRYMLPALKTSRKKL